MKKAEQFGIRAAKMSQEGHIEDCDGNVPLIDITEVGTQIIKVKGNET